MNRPFPIAVAIAVITAVTFVLVAVLVVVWQTSRFDPEFLDVDRFLDQGRNWAYETRTCDN